MGEEEYLLFLALIYITTRCNLAVEREHYTKIKLSILILIGSKHFVHCLLNNELKIVLSIIDKVNATKPIQFIMPIFEVIGEFLLSAVVEVILYSVLVIPGAFFRYLLSRLWRSKRTLKQYIKADAFMNGFAGLIVFVSFGILIVNL